jgi:predicted TIM-barrel fold metal-dependent hydrolase
MVLKDSIGKYVMADNPIFDPIYNYLETNHIPLMGHLGEPKNCWLPVDQMTLDNDKNYFTNHPEYHMFLHPEAPSYEAQVEVRDNILKKHPQLNFIGAHLGSLEWNIEELAKRLDQFPNFNVDFSARIGHLQYQSSKDYEKVRQFMVKYQDRLLYGTDGSLNDNISNVKAKKNSLHSGWLEQFIYLATDQFVIVKDLGGLKVQSLQLPREVVDKIYSENAVRLLGMK